MYTAFRWFLVVLALATLVTLTQLWISSEARTASSLLESARERWADQDPETGDFDGALRELELALELAKKSDDPEIEREIHLERVRVHNYRENYDLALEECDYLLRAFDPQSTEVLLLAADAALGSELPDTTLFYAEQVFEVDRTNPDILILVGQARAQLADMALSALDSHLHANLADEPARLAATAARRAAAHPPGTLQRHAALESLYAELPDPELRREALEAVEQASDHLLTASQAFVQRLRHQADGRAVAGMQTILLSAGNAEEAADLGRLALELRKLSKRTTVLIRTAMALDQLERGDQARELIQEVQENLDRGGITPRDLGDDELYDWCLLLYRLEVWGGLVNAGNLLRVRERNRQRKREDDEEVHPHDNMADFFQGVARSKKSLSRTARRNLKMWQRDFTREAFPGMMLQSWLCLAESARRLGRGANERYALYKAVNGIPKEVEDPRMAEIIGQIWFRLGEFQMKENNPTGAEKSFAHAIRLLPRRREEVETLWKEAGEAALVVRSSQRALVTTNAKVAPYEMCIKARENIDSGAVNQATFLVERILTNYPGLPNALEILAEAEFQRGHYEHAIDSLLLLAEKGFYEPRDLGMLSQISFEEFSGEQLVRWMLFDPRSAGLVSVARELERSGRASLALQTLRAYSPRKMEPTELAFFAQLLAQSGEWEQCGRLLTHIPSDSELTARISVLAIRAALEADPRGSAGTLLPTVIQSYAETIPARDPDLPGLIDLLLTRDEIGAARSVLETVDEHQGLQAPEELIRLAVVHAILENGEECADALERAEPFFEGDEASLGWLVRAADQHDFEQLVAITGELFESPFTRTELRRALLSTIETPKQGLRQLTQLEGLEDDPRYLFALEVANSLVPAPTDADAAAGNPDDEKPEVDPLQPERDVSPDDGRFLLPLVIALEKKPWAAWSLKRLERVKEPLASSSSARLLNAYCLMELGDLDRADERLTELLADMPDLRAGWLLREDLAELRAGSREAETFLELRVQRLDSIGDLDTPPQEIALARAFEARLADRREDAIAILEAALEEHPLDFALRRELARLHREPGARQRAIEEYNRLFNYGDPARIPDVIPEVLALLRAARLDGEISHGVWWAELEALESQFPGEPAVARELAERTIASAAEGRMDWGVQQAWDHLDRFRERTGGVPVESLRPGEAEAWTKLYRRHDPQRAVEFAYAELTANPVSPDLWRAWCEALTAAGQSEEAVRAYKAILAIVPEPGLLKSFALLQADRLDDPRAIRASLGGVELYLDRRTTDPDLVFRRGLSLLAGGRAGKKRGLRDMNSVWNERQTNGIDVGKLGRRYAIVLQREGYGTIAQNVLREAYLEVRDPLQVNVLQAVSHLIRLGTKPGKKVRDPFERELRGDVEGTPPEDAGDADDRSASAEDEAETRIAEKQ